MSDQKIAENEIDLVKTVFSGLPHRVDFKPYPTLRYPDPDPVLASVRREPNTRLVGEDIDLRYLLEDYDILVTSRATSTIGWCIMANKPLVFLEESGYFTSRPEARSAFEEATFFFDTRDSDWMTHLRDFLSQPVSDIQKAWSERADAYDRLVRGFFTIPEPGAGKRGARIIDNIIQTSKPLAVSTNTQV